MSDFPSEAQEQFKNYCDVAWSTIPYPKVTFTKGKKAKSYIPNAAEIFDNTITQLIEWGYPLAIEIDSKNERFHTRKFWNPLGIECVTVEDRNQTKQALLLTEYNKPGSVSEYVAKVRQLRETQDSHRQQYTKARKKIKELTEKYNSEVISLLGEAGAKVYRGPSLSFVNFLWKPTTAWFGFAEDPGHAIISRQFNAPLYIPDNSIKPGV